MAAMLAGGVMTAEGLWMPGTKLISIPRPVETINVDRWWETDWSIQPIKPQLTTEMIRKLREQIERHVVRAFGFDENYILVSGQYQMEKLHER